jgi:hypothetical protein
VCMGEYVSFKSLLSLVTTNLSRICQMVAKGLASKLYPEKPEEGVEQTGAVVV